MRAFPSYHTTKGRHLSAIVATKQRGNFIIPNLVLRQGIGPKSAFWAVLRHDPRGTSKLVRQSYRITPGKVIVRSTIAVAFPN